ncbi:MAG: hypothetical protein HUJ29_07205 [Gammaproteobacteria bacterium]|nr:hypothetical protein [Gammaproteobacteria bacterium]
MKKLLPALVLLLSSSLDANELDGSVYIDPIALKDNAYFFSSQRQISRNFAIEFGILIYNGVGTNLPSTYGYNYNVKYYFKRFMSGPFISLGRNSLSFFQDQFYGYTGMGNSMTLGTEIAMSKRITISPGFTVMQFPDINTTVAGYSLLIGFR